MSTVPPLNEISAIAEIHERCKGLSPESLRYLRAQLLRLVNSATSTDGAPAAADVAKAQEKTGELFRRKVEGE